LLFVLQADVDERRQSLPRHAFRHAALARRHGGGDLHRAAQRHGGVDEAVLQQLRDDQRVQLAFVDQHLQKV
jgi:hypothetical protein